MDDGIPYQVDFDDAGWLRWLPRLAWNLNMLVSCVTLDEGTGSPWRQTEGTRAAEVAAHLEGPHGSAWASDDAELADMEYPEEIEFERAKRARLLAVLGPFGFGETSSAGDLLKLMVRLGLVDLEYDEDGREVWRAIDPLPLPEEVLDLTPAEREKEGRLRLESLYGSLCSEIVGFLATRPTDRVKTSIARLAGRTVSDPEDVRQALLFIFESDSITVSRDVARLEHHQAFEVTVDRVRFEEEYVSVRLTPPDDLEA